MAIHPTTVYRSPSAPSTSFFMSEAGSNIVWMAPERDLVTVLRWIDKDQVDEVYDKIEHQPP